MELGIGPAALLRADRGTRWRLGFGPLPVLVIAGATVLGLLLLANAYGFHRDELYFIVAGQHPAWGYVDQPPLTPILSAAGVAILGVTPMAIRILPALALGACILLAAAMAREMGGDRRAQIVAALTIACSGLLIGGHLAVTGTYDVLAWTVISWLIVRILGGASDRLWLVVGIVGGVALLNKYTIAFLAVGLVAGVLIERRWSIVRSPWVWAGLLVAVLVWSPNLVWQAANGFPQLEMARHIAEATGAENQAQLIPLQLILAGPLLWPVLLIGLGRLLLTAAARPWRLFAWAYLVALALTWQQEGKAYYVIGLFPVLFAAGSIGVGAWVGRGRRRLRAGLFGVAAAASGALMALIVLPILPPVTLASSGILDINKESGEQIGWPELASAVDRVASGLTAAERQNAIVLTSNYGEAGALQLLGTNLPPVYSGHNSYWDFGMPPDGATVAIIVGRPANAGIGQCEAAGYVDNDVGIENEVRGEPISVCRRLPDAWADVWAAYRHLD